MSAISSSDLDWLHQVIDDGLGCAATGLELSGARVVLPAAFDVTGLAVGAVASAAQAAARLLALRQESSAIPGVQVNTAQAAAAFAAERRFTPIGWSQPPLWDPIAGNYQCATGWIRLHTNYPHHRAVVENLLNATDRTGVQTRVAGMDAEELEAAVIEAGGAAATLRSRQQWLTTAAGAATADEPAISTSWSAAWQPPTWQAGPERPFDGVKVLDLTRVIAGPICTKFLAGYGADVLRIDPPGFPEVASLLPITTVGKRTAFLDLNSADARTTFAELVAGADILVCGLRPTALQRLGYSDEQLRALNPNLIIAQLNAYGFTGPWRQRRGFDSLVQLASGIAAQGRAPGASPGALPVQALDHATGWLLAAAITRALIGRLTKNQTAIIRASLIGTANLLYRLPVLAEPGQLESSAAGPMVHQVTDWGSAQVVGPAAQIQGVRQLWRYRAGPLGRHAASW